MHDPGTCHSHAASVASGLARGYERCARAPTMGCAGSQPSGGNTRGDAAAHFAAIRDRFETIDEVQKELRAAGLEASDVIVAIDLTKSNEWSGKDSFQSAHSLARRASVGGAAAR